MKNVDLSSFFSGPAFSIFTGKRDQRFNVIREMWDLVHRLPGGKYLFSEFLGRFAPYTGTIHARVEVLRPGHCELNMRETRALQNHLNSIHAVALVNLAELCGNLALAYSMPDDARFIVVGLSIDYLKKGRGKIRAVCDCLIPQTNETRDYEMDVELLDDDHVLVAKAKLKTRVGPKPKSAQVSSS